MWEEFELQYKNGIFQLIDCTTDSNIIASTIVDHKKYNLQFNQCNDVFDYINFEELIKIELDKFIGTEINETNNIIKSSAFEFGFMKALELFKNKSNTKYTKADLIRVEKCYLRECDNDVKYRGQIVQRIENEKIYNTRKVLVEMEQSGFVVSGGLQSMDNVLPTGLTYHSEYNLKIDSNGFINLKKYYV